MIDLAPAKNFTGKAFSDVGYQIGEAGSELAECGDRDRKLIRNMAAKKFLNRPGVAADFSTEIDEKSRVGTNQSHLSMGG
jgi:hypothetical protein